MLLPCLQCHELVWSFEVQKDGRGLLTRFWRPLHHYQVKYMILTRTSAKIILKLVSSVMVSGQNTKH